MKLLELKNITKRYGSLYALDKVNLSIDKGEWIAIMGPSGSGKSTMMNIISCMDKPTEGQVIFDGRDITKDGRRKLTEELPGAVFSRSRDDTSSRVGRR